MKSAIATLILLVCSGLASANIVVTGHGKVVYVPDQAVVGVGVSSDGKTAAQAWEKNREIVNKIFEALKKNGIAERDLKTTNLHVSPRYLHRKDEAPVLLGYTVTYDLSITVRSLSDLGKVLDDCVESGANRQMNIGFTCSNPEKYLDEARIKAATDARKRAELYATAAGAEVGRVLSISEGSNPHYRTLQFEYAPKMATADLKIAAGEQEMSVDVTLVYAIGN